LCKFDLSLRSLVLEAQTAPIRFAERAAQVKHMLGRCAIAHQTTDYSTRAPSVARGLLRKNQIFVMIVNHD